MLTSRWLPELCSAWTTEGGRPYAILDGRGRPSLHKHIQIESPEVMLGSFLSASSSRLDPC
jgi:hypothetical protein